MSELLDERLRAELELRLRGGPESKHHFPFPRIAASESSDCKDSSPSASVFPRTARACAIYTSGAGGGEIEDWLEAEKQINTGRQSE